jgi:hypothetical protein
MLNPAAKYKPQDFMLAAPLSDVVIILMVRSEIDVISALVTSTCSCMAERPNY